MIKAQISGRMVSSDISDVVFASIHSEKTRLKKLIMIIIIMKKIARNDFFFAGARNWLPLWKWGQKSDGILQIWCSIQVSHHREPPEVGLVVKLSGSLYWWVELGVPSLHRECYCTLWYHAKSRLYSPVWCSLCSPKKLILPIVMPRII